MITHHSATSGRGGMDQGSPETFIIKKIEKVVDITKKMQRPHPVENPDFSKLIKNLENRMDDIVNDKYHDDDDDFYYVWEEAMKAVYGKDVFDWWNKNV